MTRDKMSLSKNQKDLTFYRLEKGGAKEAP